jgi:hypothetical protein
VSAGLLVLETSLHLRYQSTQAGRKNPNSLAPSVKSKFPSNRSEIHQQACQTFVGESAIAFTDDYAFSHLGVLKTL